MHNSIKAEKRLGTENQSDSADRSAHLEQLDDLELVKLVNNGERLAYREIVERYQKRVFSLVFSLVKNTQDAQDITQEIFVKAFFSLKNFRADASLYTWLYRISFNMSVDFKRRKGVRGGDSVEFDEAKIGASSSLGTTANSALDRASGQTIWSGLTPDQVLHRREQSARISAALKSLSDDHRTVVTLREIEGLSYDEISRITGAGIGTVMSRLHYARKKLQQLLKDIF